MSDAKRLHEDALSYARQYLRAESALLEVLMKIDSTKAYRDLGYPSLYTYCREALKLSEPSSYYFSSVARKSREVPELKAAIGAGKITLSQARRIVPVIAKDNQAIWIDKAATLPQRDLEREVASVNPKAAILEKVKPVSADRSELRLSMALTLEKKLRRAQDFAAQKKKKHCSLEETLEELVEFYLERQDPLRKAERASSSGRINERNNTVDRGRFLPAYIKHQVVLRDQGRCTQCQSQRWLEIHHKTPLSQGGLSNPANLISLCSFHHRQAHRLRP